MTEWHCSGCGNVAFGSTTTPQHSCLSCGKRSWIKLRNRWFNEPENQKYGIIGTRKNRTGEKMKQIIFSNMEYGNRKNNKARRKNLNKLNVLFACANLLMVKRVQTDFRPVKG